MRSVPTADIVLCMKSFLAPEQRCEFKIAHKQECFRRHADRIKAILLLDDGWDYAKVAEVLLLDDQTVRNYEKTFKSHGFDGLLSDSYNGGTSKLSVEQEQELVEHLKDNLHSSAKEIVAFVKETFDVLFTPQGMVHTIHRLGFVYKKTKAVPGKADPEKQEKFIEKYKQLKEEKNHNDKIFFMDGTHPHHNPMPAYCWILKGETKEIPTNTGRDRINFNGVIDAETHEVIIRDDERINAQSTIELFKQIEEKNPGVANIFIIADNARYYKAKIVNEYLETSRIKINFLPPYSPNLNLIERLWKFFHEKTLYNKYYDTFAKFKNACYDFFDNISQYKIELRSRLSENFEIIGKQISKT